MAVSDLDFDREYDLAKRRGEERLRNQPLAIAVRYDRRLRKVIIELNNGCSLLIPSKVVQGLATASSAQLSKVEIMGPGTTIAWPRLDLHFSVDGLLDGRFGTRAWMNELSRQIGPCQPELNRPAKTSSRKKVVVRRSRA